MRFRNWYSISILLILITFVVMIASLFFSGSKSSLSGFLSKNASDCQTLKQATEEDVQELTKEAKEASTKLRQPMKNNPSYKQRFMEIGNLHADSSDKSVRLWKSIRLQEPKSKQIQSLKVEGHQLLAKSFRNAVKAIASQPGESIKLPEPARTEHQQTLKDGFTKLAQAAHELKTYCNLDFDESAKLNGAVSKP